MKKVKLEGKLSLRKETIARLNDQDMRNIKGGVTSIISCETGCGHTCNTAQTCGPECPSSPLQPQTCDNPYNTTCLYTHGC